MARLRIAVVTPELPNREYPTRGGSVYQTVRQLCHSAEVQAFCPLPKYPSRLRPQQFDYRECDLSYSLQGLPTHYFEYPALPLVTRPLNGFTCARFLAPLVRSFRPDVILNFVLYPAGFAAVTVGRKLGVPVIVGAIGSDLNAIPDRISSWLTRKTLRGAFRVIAKSEQLRERAIALGANAGRIHLVTNGCDADLFASGDRSRARRELNLPRTESVVLFVGRIHHRKGVHELLKAVALLLHKRPELHLVYVGDGPELQELRANARDIGFGGRVRFAGECSSAEVVQWLTAADLLALPSYAEGCPNAVIEALSCGRPVVASRVGAIPAMIDGSCGIMVPPGDVTSLSRAIDTALTIQWDEHAIGERFRRSWQQVADEVLEICQASVDAVPPEFGREQCVA